jgi:hypothetical protein
LALQFIASEAEVASLRQYAPTHSAVTSLGTYFCFWDSVRHYFRHDDAGDLVELEPAVLLRYINRAQAQVRGFLQQFAQQARFLFIDLLDARDDFFLHKLLRRPGNELVLIGQILRREDVAGTSLLNQKAAALDASCGRRAGHVAPLINLHSTGQPC